MLRPDGRAALESADALEATGYKLHAMLASSLRFLYYVARGELAKAAPHRDQLELHAAHVGSLWQVEASEGAPLLLIYSYAMGDVVGAERLCHRLEAVSKTVPSLKRYSRLAHDALSVVVHHDRRAIDSIREKHMRAQPREFVGWAITQSAVIRILNDIGEYAAAREYGAAVLAHTTEADRDMAMLFVPLDIQIAFADAGLGRVDDALARVDQLLARFAHCDHPLLQGILHETRAYICWRDKRIDAYRFSLAQTERWYRPTGTPALIARCERLADLSQAKDVLLARPEPSNDTRAVAEVEDLHTAAMDDSNTAI